MQTQGLLFLGADQIATEIRPDAPEAVRIQAGRGMRRYLDRMRKAGYTVRVVFIFLESAEHCVRRVRQRIEKGCHHVPREDVVRRFHRSIQNFWTVYRPRADRWTLFFNGGDRFCDVASGSRASYTVQDNDLFDSLLSHQSPDENV